MSIDTINHTKTLHTHPSTPYCTYRTLSHLLPPICFHYPPIHLAVAHTTRNYQIMLSIHSVTSTRQSHYPHRQNLRAVCREHASSVSRTLRHYDTTATTLYCLTARMTLVNRRRHVCLGGVTSPSWILSPRWSPQRRLPLIDPAAEHRSGTCKHQVSMESPGCT